LCQELLHFRNHIPSDSKEIVTVSSVLLLVLLILRGRILFIVDVNVEIHVEEGSDTMSMSIYVVNLGCDFSM
jgi:hypoxanthine-guanine phosphoribosyltransferase